MGSASPSAVYRAVPGACTLVAVRLRIALIVLALVVLPALVFAVAENHPASHPVVGWTAYAPSDVTHSSPDSY